MRVVAKGLSPGQRANLIVGKMSCFLKPVCFEVDGKAFEAHVDVWQLREEHQVYQAAYGNKSAGLLGLLKHQLRNFGVTQGGVKFERDGGRASGDFNTGMGNSIIMLAVVDAVMRELGYKFSCLVDGDNALIFVEEADHLSVVREFGPLALRFSGHEMVLERPVSEVEEIRFGQSAPVLVGGRWTMVRSPDKVLSNGAASHAHLHDLAFAGQWLTGVAYCENFLARGVPLLETWSYQLWHAVGRKEFIKRGLYRDYEVLGVPVERLTEPVLSQISDSTRWSFFKAFGVTPEEQIVMERQLRESQVTLGPWRAEEPVTFENREFHHCGW